MENRKSKNSYNQHLIAEACLQGKFYHYSDIEPCVFFWKQLATINHGAICLIPDTLLINDKQNPLIWIYTDTNGQVNKCFDINLKDYVNKLTNYSSPNQLIATLKRPTYNDNCVSGNDIKLLNARYLQNCSLQQLAQKNQVVCLQRYVKSNGSKAYICRTIWRKVKSSQCFTITAKKTYHDATESQTKKFLVKVNENCNVIKSSQGRNLKQTLVYLQNIAKYFQMYRGKVLTQLVGDFIKDETGNWWLVNIKAFQSDNKILKTIPKLTQNIEQQYQKQKYQKTKLCRYCQKKYLQSQLNFSMTIKMLIQTDKYLLHLGNTYKWLQRSQLNNVDTHCLYQQHKICQRCYRLYIEIQKLMQLQNKLTNKFGMILDKQPKQLIQNLNYNNQLLLQTKNQQITNLSTEIPEIIQLGPNSNIIIKDNTPIRNDQIINKMLRYRVILYFKEFDEMCNIKPNTNYYLEYNVLGNKNKIKLDIHNCKNKVLLLQKLRIFYFFAHSHDDLIKHFVENRDFVIEIVVQNKKKTQRKVIGSLNLPMNEYFSTKHTKRDFYKLFHMNNIPYGWGLQGSIGITPSKDYVNTSRNIFTSQDKLIYSPSMNYYYCQPLPEQWIDRIKLKSQQQLKMNEKVFIDSMNSTQYRKSPLKEIINQQKSQSTIQSISWKDILMKEIRSYQKRDIKNRMIC